MTASPILMEAREALLPCPSRESALDAVAKLHLMPCMNATDDLKQSEYCILLRKFINAATPPPPLPADWLAALDGEAQGTPFDGAQWDINPDGDRVIDLADESSNQLAIAMQPDGSVTFAAYTDGNRLHGYALIDGTMTPDFKRGLQLFAARLATTPPPPAEPVAEARELLTRIAMHEAFPVRHRELMSDLQAFLGRVATHPAEASAQDTGCDVVGFWNCKLPRGHTGPHVRPDPAPPPAPERAEPHPSHRWNVEPTERGYKICRGEHDKGDDCDWEYLVPESAAPQAAAQAWLTRNDDGDPVMLFFDAREAATYCADNASPEPLYLAPPTPADLVARLGGLAKEWASRGDGAYMTGNPVIDARTEADVGAYTHCADELRAALAGVKA